MLYIYLLFTYLVSMWQTCKANACVEVAPGAINPPDSTVKIPL